MKQLITTSFGLSFNDFGDHFIQIIFEDGESLFVQIPLKNYNYLQQSLNLETININEQTKDAIYMP